MQQDRNNNLLLTLLACNSEEVGHGHVNRARMQLSRRGLHAGALTSSGHCLVLLSCELRVLQNFAGS